MVRIPQITSLETALKVYYENMQLGNAEIRRLFGNISNKTACKLKEVARAKMRDDGVMLYNATCVNSKVAYEAWGLDIEEMERRYKKLQKLNLVEATS